jgi:hypothetical protein
MICRTRIVQIGGVVLGLLATSAMAAPPIFSNHSRAYGNDVGANICVDFPWGQRCADLYAWENYDVKGTYQYTGISIWYSYHRPFPEGGWRQGSRWMSCQVGLETITAQPNHVTLEATLHPNGPECESDGFIEECDAFGFCDTTPWGFNDPTEVTGEWIDPMNTSKAVVNRTDKYYDPWSETSHRTVSHCNESNGDLMTRGGFSIDVGRAIRHFPFEGVDTQGWNHYWLRSCNENFKVK